MLELVSPFEAEEAASAHAHRAADAPSEAVGVVRRVLSLPDEELDYARAKLAFDQVVDPTFDSDAVLAELDEMTERARQLAGPGSDESAKLAAVRTFIYESGPWNDFRPFDYEPGDFKSIHVKLLPHYLETRRGNCVSMPILFMILADRMGLDISLALAPVHLFVRCRLGSGPVINIEATSGGLPARDVWMRHIRKVNERSIRAGYCMRMLSRREAVAAMASTVIEHLAERRRFADAIAASEIVLRHNPFDGMAWAKLGNAYCALVRIEFLDRYGSPFLIPLHLRPRYTSFLHCNRAAFAAAKKLGWEPVE